MAIAVPAVAVAVLAVAPVAYLLVQVVVGKGDPVAVLTDPRTWLLARNSVALVVAGTLSALAIALPAALVVTRTDLPGRNVFAVLCSVPLVVPSFLAAFALRTAFGPRGALQQMLAPFGVERLPGLDGFAGSWLALTLVTFPFVFIPVVAALRDADPSLEEAARSLGLSARRALLRAALPQVRPAATVGALMIALYLFAEFGAVSTMGYRTLITEIVQQRDLGSPAGVAALSLLLVAASLVVVTVQLVSRGPLQLSAAAPGVRRRATPLHLGVVGRLVAWAGLGLVVALALGVPVLTLAFWTVRGLQRGNELGDGFAGDLLSATWNSLTVAGSAAVIAIAAVLPAALLIVRHPGRLATFTEHTLWAAHGLPGPVLAVAFAYIALAVLLPLYQTVALLVLALAAHFLPNAIGSTQQSIAQLNPHVEEASRSLGRSWPRTFGTVTLPLLLRGIAAGAALVFLNVMKELPVTYVLQPIGFDTLALRVYFPAQELAYTKAGIAGLLLLCVTSVPMALLLLPRWRRGT